jgi:hypothetical protein
MSKKLNFFRTVRENDFPELWQIEAFSVKEAVRRVSSEIGDICYISLNTHLMMHGITGALRCFFFCNCTKILLISARRKPSVFRAFCKAKMILWVRFPAKGCCA